MIVTNRNDSCSRRGTHRTNQESGVALILALICLLLISALAAAIMFSTQSELWTTANYRAVSQARYAAEAGLQQAVNYLQGATGGWTAPASPNNLDGSNFTLAFPVKYKGSAVAGCSTTPCNVVLNASGQGLTGTYAFDSTTSSAFAAAFTNVSLPMPSNAPAGTAPTYTVSAQLLDAQSSASGWVTRWKVFSQGSVGNAKVQLVAVVNKVFTVSNNSSTAPSFKAAMLATGTGCGSSNVGTIDMNGGSNHTNSYDSALAGNKNNSSPALIGSGGDVISYGNINVSSGAKIYGNVFSSNYNTGAAGTYGISNSAGNGMNGGKACGSGSPAVTYSVNEDNSGSQVGCTSSGCPDSNSGWYSPSPLVYNQRTYAIPSGYSSIPDPVMPTVATNTAVCVGYNGLCNGGSGGGSGCAITIPPSTKPDGSAGAGASNFGVTNFGSCAVITLQAGTYNFDTLYISNGAKVIVPSTGSVVINILNASNASTPLNFDGGTVSNGGGDPNNLTFVYGPVGTPPSAQQIANASQTVNINAGAAMFATIYAPHAKIVNAGGSALFGAVVGSTFSVSGSGMVNYDINLGRANTHIPISGSTPAVTNMHIDQFSWSAY